MAEDNTEVEQQPTSNPLQRTAEYHNKLGGNPEVRDKVVDLQDKLTRAIELVTGDTSKPLNKSREETVLDILTGVNYLAIDPHRLGMAAGEDQVSAKDTIRLANFVRAVAKIGTVNEDGSVSLNVSTNTTPGKHEVRVQPGTKL